MNGAVITSAILRPDAMCSPDDHDIDARVITLDHIAQRLAMCPANAWLGLIPEAIEDAGVLFRIPVRPEMAGSPVTGAMHGGMVAALIDTLCTFAWLAHNRGRVSTVDMRIDFHRPITADQLLGRGRLVRAGRKIVTADGEITALDGTLLASGRAVFVPYPDTSN